MRNFRGVSQLFSDALGVLVSSIIPYLVGHLSLRTKKSYLSRVRCFVDV